MRILRRRATVIATAALSLAAIGVFASSASATKIPPSPIGGCPNAYTSLHDHYSDSNTLAQINAILDPDGDGVLNNPIYIGAPDQNGQYNLNSAGLNDLYRLYLLFRTTTETTNPPTAKDVLKSEFVDADDAGKVVLNPASPNLDKNDGNQDGYICVTDTGDKGTSIQWTDNNPTGPGQLG